MKVTKGVLGSEKPISDKYYALIGDMKLTDNERAQLVTSNWLAITHFDAEDCIRPEGSGIMIGNGEDWEKLDGYEKLWCDGHKCFVRLDAWIQV